ncbi:hypothetical protein [Variovorax paradoxus]|jgi:hypothetical protein|uniref:hypothetical protein n=1 Tax=Variovorax paradoxus TaxID=34073 RepID=UPI0030D14D20
MEDKHSRDPWMDRPHDAMAAWERSLRPTKSSSLMWPLIGVAVAAGVACLIFSSWPGAGPVRRATERPGTSAPSPGATAPAAPAARMDPQPQHEPAAPRTQSFAKCISAAGAISYSDGACRQGTRAAAVTVNPDLNLADGMSDAERQASIRNNSAIARSVAEHERRVAMNVDGPSTECASLKALIASIDAAALRPQPAFEQDRLKDERRRANDRVFALRCS